MQNNTNVVTMSENRMAALKQRATQQQGEVRVDARNGISTTLRNF